MKLKFDMALSKIYLLNQNSNGLERDHTLQSALYSFWRRFTHAFSAILQL